ncbi:MAG: DnaJ domain-containing protein [Clostridia bacterium]
MEKNYYDILEVNKNASPEVIEKAYKTLVKKYHPDLQDNNLKNEYEEKIKLINEAFEVLSDSEKRKNYDLNLKQTEFSIEDYNNLISENLNLKNEINYLKNNLNNYKNNSQNNINNNLNNNSNNKNSNYSNNINYQNNQNTNNDYSRNFQQKYNEAINKAYYDAYIQDLKNRGYKIRYKKTFKEYVKSLFSLFITLIILFLFFQIPFIKNYFLNNELIKIFIQSFK